MRAFVGIIAAVVFAAAACSQGPAAPAVSPEVQRDADLYQIDQIEVNWHKAASTHDIDLMMSLWADDATFTIGGQTYSGKDQIRTFIQTKAAPFQPQNHWVSDTPAYKVQATVSGDKGTLYFECHYIDPATGKVMVVVGANQDVARVDGSWVITSSIGASPVLAP